jgi:hypothetical protein
MQRFIKRVLVFVLSVVVLVIVVFGLQKKLLFKAGDLKIQKQSTVLILGHSHPECAINTKYIENTFNLCESGEAYIYTYFKTKKVIESNPQIKKVFVEYTNNQIYKKDMNNWMWGDVHLQYRIKRYGLLLDREAMLLLYKKNPTGLINAFSKSLFDNIERFFYDNKGIVLKGGFGRYTPSDKIFANASNKQKKRKLNGVSEHNIFYLQKIVKYCQERGLEVCLVRSPMHKSYDVSFSEHKFQEILHTKFKNVEWIDHKDYPIPDIGFQDAEHLNSYGAKIYSQYFNKLIN